MPTSSIGAAIQHIRKTVPMQDQVGLTDAQLLERFIADRDEAAFAALVLRHGLMVMGVCLRAVRNHQDAEDAFQATFLVLVRKAASIASRELLANWLYGVAFNTAIKARASNIKRQAKEKQVTEMPDPAMAERELWDDNLQTLLDQELSRLPDKYRAPVILCDLEGKTRKEAAQVVGCPIGSLSSRLSRARTMLAERLARHGLALSGGSLAAVLAQNAQAYVPASVVSSTTKAASFFAAGQAATGVISTRVADLTDGVLKTMLLTKLKTVAAMLMMLTMAVLATAMLAWGQPGGTSNSLDKPHAEAEKQAAPAQPKDPPKEFKNSIGMKFVWIKPGTFMMGTPKDEERGEIVNDETQCKVTLTKGFYMGIYPVTQEQWQEIMGNNPSKFKGEKNLPVDTVSWDDCQEFIKKLREKDKKPYRLPTEAEREFSCRAGTTTPFNFGDTISTDQANYDGDGVYGKGQRGVNRNKTTPVGSFPPNAWGLYDMHGNVLQWCQDWLGDYPKNDVVDPQGPEKGTLRVVRGGSWYGHPQYIRSAFRYSVEPGVRHDRCGLRVCFFFEE
jgi:RNA polymerase sigma factor (sigma-70 family)